MHMTWTETLEYTSTVVWLLLCLPVLVCRQINHIMMYCLSLVCDNNGVTPNALAVGVMLSWLHRSTVCTYTCSTTLEGREGRHMLLEKAGAQRNEAWRKHLQRYQWTHLARSVLLHVSNQIKLFSHFLLARTGFGHVMSAHTSSSNWFRFSFSICIEVSRDMVWLETVSMNVDQNCLRYWSNQFKLISSKCAFSEHYNIVENFGNLLMTSTTNNFGT